MEGVGKTLSHRHSTFGQTAPCLHLWLPPHCCLLSWCYKNMQANSTSWAYHPSPLPSALPAPGIDLVWRWGVTFNSLDHTLCLMLIMIGLARSKKVSATVKPCLWGRYCEAKCLRLFSHAKSYRVSVLPQTFWSSYRYNRGKRSFILLIATVLAIQDVV